MFLTDTWANKINIINLLLERSFKAGRDVAYSESGRVNLLIKSSESFILFASGLLSVSLDVKLKIGM